MRMVLNCITSTTKMVPASRAKLIAKSLIFLLLLALAGIGIATGSERASHAMAPVRAAMVAGQQNQAFGGWDGRNDAPALRGILG